MRRFESSRPSQSPWFLFLLEHDRNVAKPASCQAIGLIGLAILIHINERAGA
jgi:hypothetical protein